MPTAYRGKGKNTIGLGLDFNAAYYIGRLYGKNKLAWTLQKSNYIDRVGVWLLTSDAKMLVQTESKWRPAMAAGVHGTFALRDAPAPTLNSPSVSVSVDQKNTRTLGGVYLVLSKRPHPRFLTSAGYMEGNVGDIFPMLSEFLTQEAWSDIPKVGGKSATSRNLLFGGFTWFLKPTFPIGAEIIIPQGAPASPKLINLHLGSLLKLNFELSYLTFQGGWDLLGMFQFRYSYFPK
ncbi:MAG: hypothetical protein ABIG11_04790 [bacterium]